MARKDIRSASIVPPTLGYLQRHRFELDFARSWEESGKARFTLSDFRAALVEGQEVLSRQQARERLKSLVAKELLAEDVAGGTLTYSLTPLGRRALLTLQNAQSSRRVAREGAASEIAPVDPLVIARQARDLVDLLVRRLREEAGS